MRSGRGLKTFHLTTINSRTPRQNVTRPRPRSFELKFQSLSVFSDQIVRLRALAAELRAKNAELRQEIEMMQDHWNDPGKREYLAEGFEATLANCLKEIELRKRKVDDLEKRVMIFRPADKDEVAAPRNVRTARLQRMEAENRQRRHGRPFPPPSLLPNKRSDPVRAQELKEHRDLIEKSLYLERMIVIQKMKLKICHDHRIMEQLKLELSQIEDDDADDTDSEVQAERNRVRRLKEQILREKERIREEQDEHNYVHFAAVAIQSAWRGYLQRRNKNR